MQVKEITGDMLLHTVIINPDIEAVIRQAPEFIHATSLGDKVIRKGSIGSIAGLDVLVTTSLKQTSGQTYVIAGITDAITFASQITKIESMRSECRFKDLIRGLYVYGAKTVNTKQLAKLVVGTAS